LCVRNPKRQQHTTKTEFSSHFFLVTIHPFGDGNGRVSRLVEAGILFQGGYNVLGFYGLSNYFYRNEAEYKMTLQKCREMQPFDMTPFVTFGLKGFASELNGINNFIKAKLNRVVYRAMLVRAINKKMSDRRRVLNQREYNLLDYLLQATEPTDPFSENPSRKIKGVYRRCQRAIAPFLAISRRLEAESFLALAFPPFGPPSLPMATACGFLPASGFSKGVPSRCSPMVCSTTRRATTVKSCGVPSRFGFAFVAVLERLGMPQYRTIR